MKRFDAEGLRTYLEEYNKIVPVSKRIDLKTAENIITLTDSWEDISFDEREQLWECMNQREQTFFLSLHATEYKGLYAMPDVIDPYTYPDIERSLERLNLPDEVRRYVLDHCRVINAGDYNITREELKTFYEERDVIMVCPETVYTEEGMLRLATQIALSYLNYGWRVEDKSGKQIRAEDLDAEELAKSWGWWCDDEPPANPDDKENISTPTGDKNESLAMISYKKTRVGKVYL